MSAMSLGERHVTNPSVANPCYNGCHAPICTVATIDFMWDDQQHHWNYRINGKFARDSSFFNGHHEFEIEEDLFLDTGNFSAVSRVRVVLNHQHQQTGAEYHRTHFKLSLRCRNKLARPGIV